MQRRIVPKNGDECGVADHAAADQLVERAVRPPRWRRARPAAPCASAGRLVCRVVLAQVILLQRGIFPADDGDGPLPGHAGGDLGGNCLFEAQSRRGFGYWT